MKDKIYRSLVAVCYVVAFIILFFCIKGTSNFSLSTFARISFILMSCALIYVGGLILTKKLNFSKKILNINLILYFIIYTITICSLTLFDELYGRQGLIIIDWDRDLLNMYTKNSFNIIPFSTINLYIRGYINGIVSFKNFSVNIIGNFFAFMPYGIFLPLIFKKFKKYYNFLLAMIIIVVIIELLQFVTMSGSCDIDDLILNVFGASIIYLIFRFKFINNFICKFFYGSSL